MNILRFYIQNLTMILKVKSCRIYLSFIYEPICRCKMQIWHQLFIIIYLLTKNKSERSSTKFKASLNLHQSSHTRQFEDSEYKSNITKCFSNLNPNVCPVFTFCEIDLKILCVTCMEITSKTLRTSVIQTFLIGGNFHASQLCQLCQKILKLV